MSYSRWSNSVWYTYQATIDAEHKEEERFEICGVTHFNYAQLKRNLEACVKHVKGILEIKRLPEIYTSDTFEELRGYMHQFIRDVEDDYAEKSATGWVRVHTQRRLQVRDPYLYWKILATIAILVLSLGILSQAAWSVLHVLIYMGWV